MTSLALELHPQAPFALHFRCGLRPPLPDPALLDGGHTCILELSQLLQSRELLDRYNRLKDLFSKRQPLSPAQALAEQARPSWANGNSSSQPHLQPGCPLMRALKEEDGIETSTDVSFSKLPP